MVVALRASRGETEEDSRDGVGSIDVLVRSELRSRLDSRFAIDEHIAMESGGDLLVDARVGEEVPRQLLEHEARRMAWPLFSASMTQLR